MIVRATCRRGAGPGGEGRPGWPADLHVSLVARSSCTRLARDQGCAPWRERQPPGRVEALVRFLGKQLFRRGRTALISRPSGITRTVAVGGLVVGGYFARATQTMPSDSSLAEGASTGG